MLRMCSGVKVFFARPDDRCHPPRPDNGSDLRLARSTFTKPDFKMIVRSTRHNAMANLNI